MPVERLGRIVLSAGMRQLGMAFVVRAGGGLACFVSFAVQPAVPGKGRLPLPS